MTSVLARTLGAALLFTAVPAMAEMPQAPVRSAIATGLAIPIDLPEERDAPIPVMGRLILVDAASAKLFMIEDGTVVDSMRVIVGKPSAATPMLQSRISYATVNPYWHVPVDLARTLIAPNVLEKGSSYLDERGYEVVSRFAEDAEVLSAEAVDWQAVADGREEVYVRQRPGPANSMGRIKFGFPNGDGIFLHDTPRKALFEEEDRSLSNGCVRLEDASRLARWLIGDDPVATAESPEQHVPLPASVPIVITYLEAPARVQLTSLER